MPNFDIDNLKKTWQEQNIPPKYEQDEILEMLNAKSINYVKYILWISCAEFLLIFILQLNDIFTDGINENIVRIFQRMGIKITAEIMGKLDIYYSFIDVLGLIISGIFVVGLYFNYKKIKVEKNLKYLILRIKTFRKIVNTFIIINFILLAINIITFLYLTWYMIDFQGLILSDTMIKAYSFGVLFGKILSFLLLYLYYRFVYGKIMKKLNNNLKELKEIESYI